MVTEGISVKEIERQIARAQEGFRAEGEYSVRDEYSDGATCWGTLPAEFCKQFDVDGDSELRTFVDYDLGVCLHVPVAIADSMEEEILNE